MPRFFNAGVAVRLGLVLLIYIASTIYIERMTWVRFQNAVEVDPASLLFTHSQRNNRRRRRRFILHPGPPKTGSTTLQCSLETLRPYLEADGYHYIGRPECRDLTNTVVISSQHRREFRVVADALIGDFACHQEIHQQQTSLNNNNDTAAVAATPSCWKDMVRILQNYPNQSIVFSDEAFANRACRTQDYRPSVPYPWQALRNVLSRYFDEVLVLTMHRPLHDYLPSVYNDLYKEGPGKVRLRRWYASEEHSACPREGGRAVPRLWDPTRGNDITVRGMMEPNQNLFPTPGSTVQVFQENGFNVTVVDMVSFVPGMDEEDLVTRFVCNHLPAADTTCRMLRQRSEPLLSEQNPSLPLHYDFVAVEACGRGYLSRNNGESDTNIPSRQHVRHELRRRQEDILGRRANDLPLDCPDQELLQSLSRLSWEHELAVHHSSIMTTNEEGEEQNNAKLRFEQSFWNAVEKKKFCTVNETRVLEDPDWVNFLKSIN